jgi:hypothetical protein
MAVQLVFVVVRALRFVGMPLLIQMDSAVPVPRFRMEVHLLLVPWIQVFRAISASTFGQRAPRDLTMLMFTYLLDTDQLAQVAEINARDSWFYSPDYPGAFWLLDRPVAPIPQPGEWWYFD